MIPPRKPFDKDTPGDPIVHKHTGINGPHEFIEAARRKYENDDMVAVAVRQFVHGRFWSTAAYSFAIGLMLGLLLGWVSA